MRVSLNLKADSRSDFGVQTRWDSRGARVQFIQPGETLAFLFFFYWQDTHCGCRAKFVLIYLLLGIDAL